MVARKIRVRLQRLLIVHRACEALRTSLLPITIAALLLVAGGVSPAAAQCSGPSCPSVTPDGGSKTHDANTSGHTAQFMVKNLGSGTDWFSISCLKTGQVTSCSPSTFSVQLGSQQSTNVTVTYAVGGGGSGTVKLRAFSFDYMEEDQGYYNVTVTAPPAQPSITPAGTVTLGRATGTSGYYADFTVTNVGGQSGTFNLTCTPNTGPNITCTGLSQSSVNLAPDADATITAYYDVGAEGQGTLALETTGYIEMGYYTVPVVPLPGPPGPPPSNWDGDVYNYDNQRCTDTCSGLTLTHSTVPYFTMDTPRNVTLVYNSERAAPRPLVQVDVAKPSGFPTLQYMKFRVKEIDGSYQTFVNGSSALYFEPAGTWTRIGGRLNTSWATGMYDIQIEVTFYHSSGSQVQTWDTKLMVVNDSDSPIGEGWAVAGIQRLYVQSDSSALIVDGGGSAVWFRKAGDSWIASNGETSTLSKYGSGFKRVYPDQTDVRFNSDGEMTDVYDPDNNHTEFVYHSSPTYHLFYIEDPMGKRTYSLFDSVAQQHKIYGGISPYRYTILEFSSGRLTKIKDPDGDSTVINYTAQTPSSVYFPTSVIDRNGNTTSYQFYATSLELWKVTAPAVDIYGYGSPQSPVAEFDPWAREVSPDSSTSSGSPFDSPASDDVWGSVTAPSGSVTSTRVNRFGSPLEIDAPAGTFDTDITYNEHGSPVKIVRSDGWGTDSIKYDSSHRPIWVRRGSTTATPRQFKYGAFSQVDSAWGGGEQTLDYHINSSTGRVDSVKVGNTAMTRYTYNTRGQVRRVMNGEGDYVSRVGYDAMGNTIADTALAFTSYGRDGYGRVTSIAASGQATRTITYDLMNRPTDIDDGVNAQDTQYDYLPTYLRVTDPKGQVYDEYVNALGWVTSSEDPLNDSHDYQYDIDGLVKRWTNRRGQNVDFTYDTLGRLKTVAGDTLSYQSVGKTVTATNAYVTETTYFTHRGQPDSVTTAFKTDNTLAGEQPEDCPPGWIFEPPSTCRQARSYRLRYTYDSLTGVLKKVEPSGDAGTFMTRQYGFNTSKGTLTSITLDGDATDFEYALDLALSQYGFPGGNDVEVGRTAGNQLEWTNADAGYGIYTDRSVDYASGRIVLQAVPGLPEGHRYGYDGLGRLLRDTTIEYTGSCGFDELTGYDCGSWTYDGHVTYSYDAANNRTDLSAGYVSGSNRLNSFDGCSYSTDDDGNITSQDCAGTSNDYTFHWDARNRLDSLNAYKFRYDPAGRLARIDFEGDPYRYFWWDRDNLLAELDTDGTVIAEYSYYPGSLDRLHAVRKDTSSTKYYAHTDAAGNVVGLTYGTNPAETYVYDAWGQPAAGGGTWVSVPNRARWKGALQFGEFGLYYMRARWYQPRTGRFLSEDPIGLAGGINPYVFGNDDPINMRDPTGTCAEDEELWVEYRTVYRDGVPIGIIVERYFCKKKGGGGSGPGAMSRRIDPRECPVPPPLPAGETVDRNIHWMNDRIAEMETMGLSGGGGLFHLWVEKVLGDWDYLVYDFEAGGNFNYGATGRVLFPRTILHRGAGFMQERLGFWREEFGHWWGPWPHGEDWERDAGDVTAGMQYFENGCNR